MSKEDVCWLDNERPQINAPNAAIEKQDFDFNSELKSQSTAKKTKDEMSELFIAKTSAPIEYSHTNGEKANSSAGMITAAIPKPDFGRISKNIVADIIVADHEPNTQLMLLLCQATLFSLSMPETYDCKEIRGKPILVTKYERIVYKGYPGGSENDCIA